MAKSNSKNSTLKIQNQENKERTVSVRFSYDDYSVIAENAQNAGLTVSEFIRQKSTKRTSVKPKIIPELNRYAYLDLSSSLQEFSKFLKLIKHDKCFADLRNGVIEKTLVKIVSQIFEVKRNLL